MPGLFVLIGPPGAGKLTVATELVRQLEAAGHVGKLVDNHRAADLLFPLVPQADGHSALPAAVADRVREINMAVLRTIDGLSPHTWSFVLTHHLLATPANEAYVDELRAVAARRGAAFVVVRVHCDPDELRRRVVQPERHGRKLIDPDVAVAQARLRLCEPEGTHQLDLTQLTPPAAAAAILQLAGPL